MLKLSGRQKKKGKIRKWIKQESSWLIGFAGPRVIEQTIGEKLPAGFQRSEFQMEHGFVDQVVPRSQLRDTLIQVLQLHAGGKHE